MRFLVALPILALSETLALAASGVREVGFLVAGGAASPKNRSR